MNNTNNNTNVFFINMEKNIGKRKSIEELVTNLSGTIWNGVDNSSYDEHGILLKINGHDINTRSAKEAKLNLFNYFLSSCTQDYLVLFEDDIVVHKKFYEHYQQVITFANINKFKLIYFGVSCNVPKINNNNNNNNESNNLTISLLPKTNYRFSGAYGVIIHRSVLKSIISKSNDPFLFNKPFDIYSLGHIQLSYPDECFICDPQIVIPMITISDIRDPRDQDLFWNYCHINPDEYMLYDSYKNSVTRKMYILADQNKEKLKQFVIHLAMLIPYVDPIFILEKQNDTKFFTELYGKIYKTIVIDDITPNALHQLITNEKYILTNIYVNWTKNVNIIFNDIESNSNITYNIKTCPKCSFNIDNNKNTTDVNQKILNGFTIINNKNNKNIITKEIEELFYVTVCKNMNNMKMHI